METKTKNYLKVFTILLIIMPIGYYISDVKNNVRLAGVVVPLLGLFLLIPFGLVKATLLEPFKSIVRKTADKVVEISYTFVTFPLQPFIIAGFCYAYAILSQGWLALTAFYLVVAYFGLPLMINIVFTFLSSPAPPAEVKRDPKEELRKFLLGLPKEFAKFIIALVLIRLVTVLLMLALLNIFNIVIEPASGEDVSLLFAVFFSLAGIDLLRMRWFPKKEKQ